MHKVLAHHHPPTLVAEYTLSRRCFENRAVRLLELEKKRVTLIPSFKQYDPGASPNASDTDNPEGHIDETISLQQPATVWPERR